MRATESIPTWRKFLTAVEVLAVIENSLSGADSAVERESHSWVNDERTRYKEHMGAAFLFLRVSQKTLDAAALNLLSEQAVETLLSVVERSCHHAVIALGIALTWKHDMRNVPAYRDRFDATLKSIR